MARRASRTGTKAVPAPALRSPAKSGLSASSFSTASWRARAAAPPKRSAAAWRSAKYWISSSLASVMPCAAKTRRALSRAGSVGVPSSASPPASVLDAAASPLAPVAPSADGSPSSSPPPQAARVRPATSSRIHQVVRDRATCSIDTPPLRRCTRAARSRDSPRAWAGR